MRNFKKLSATAKLKKKNDFSSYILTLIENTIWNGISRAFNEMIDNDGSS